MKAEFDDANNPDYTYWPEIGHLLTFYNAKTNQTITVKIIAIHEGKEE